MTPVDYVVLGTVSAAALPIINIATEKTKTIKSGQGLEVAEQDVEMRVDLIARKLEAAQNIMSKVHFTKKMSDSEAQAFYLNRRAEFAGLASELKTIECMAEAGGEACVGVIQIAQERSRHWKLTLLLTDYCPLM